MPGFDDTPRTTNTLLIITVDIFANRTLKLAHGYNPIPRQCTVRIPNACTGHHGYPSTCRSPDTTISSLKRSHFMQGLLHVLGLFVDPLLHLGDIHSINST